MKKPSLNPAAVGGFFVRHGEKLAFGILGLFGLVMVWWGIDAVRSQSVDKGRTPQAVQELASQAASHIEAVTKVPADRLPSLSPLSPQVDPWRPQQVKIVDAATSPPVFNRPLLAELTKRTKPEVFPIEDLQAVAGIAVLPDELAEARGGREPPAGRPADLQPPPVPEEPRGGRRPGRRNPRETAGEGIFGGGEVGGGMQPEVLAAEPLEPGRITPFIVVTGLIPTAKQRAEFDNRFGSVSFRDPRRDAPRWGEYIVERARVVPGANPNWERLKLTNVLRAGPEEGRPGVRGGAEGGMPGGPALTPETLPGGFFLQPEEAEVGYVAPLPERIDEPWGSAAVHPWFVPELRKFLAGEVPQADEPAAAGAATLADLAAKPGSFVGKEVSLPAVLLDATPERQRDVGLFKFGVRSADGSEAVEVQTIGLADKLVFATSADWGAKLSFDLGDKPRPCKLLVRIDMVGKTPVARILEIQFLDDAGEVAETRSESKPEPVAATDELGLAAGMVPAAEGITSGPLAEQRLFRFIDTAVDPGAEYRYRVRFALRNPNVGLAPQHVADTAITRGDFLVSRYSNETSPVRVPDPTRVLARTIPRDAARKLKLKADVVELLVLAKSEETGNFALRSTVTPVGGIANVDPSLNRPASVRFFGEPVTTDRILVDVRGLQEERAEGRSPVPPEPLAMLMLRPDGGFEFVTAAESEPIVTKYRGTLFKQGADAPDDGKPDTRDREAPNRGFP